MKHGLAAFLLMFAFSHSTFADGLFPIEEFPIEEETFCHPGERSELTRDVVRTIRSAQASVKCGNYAEAREKLFYALDGIDELDTGTATEIGYCYSKDNCRGAKVSGVKMKKADCKTSGIGESWQRTDPTAGSCEDVVP
jgi:nucleoside 2-deoxyribosyltransferase